MTEFTREVITIIKNIPKGKVMTYGQIAAWAGNPWGARQISRILNSLSAPHQLPWHRVVNAKGGISLSDEGGLEQAQRLIDEGVEVNDFTVDLTKYRHEP